MNSVLLDFPLAGIAIVLAGFLLSVFLRILFLCQCQRFIEINILCRNSFHLIPFSSVAVKAPGTTPNVEHFCSNICQCFVICFCEEPTNMLGLSFAKYQLNVVFCNSVSYIAMCGRMRKQNYFLRLVFILMLCLFTSRS